MVQLMTRFGKQSVYGKHIGPQSIGGTEFRPLSTIMDKREKDRLSLAPEAGILCISMLVVVAIGTLSYINAGRLERATEELRITRGIESVNRELLSALTDAETGQRGFLLTGQEVFLEPYTHALTVIPGLLKGLERLTLSRPDQRERFKAMEPLVAAKLQEMKQTIELRRANNSAEALAVVSAGTGKGIMDELRSHSDTIDQAAEERLARFRLLADANSSRLRIVSTAGSALLLVFLVVSAITIFRGIERREDLFRQCHASEKKLAITLSSIADGVISTDAAARITFLNPVAQQLTGWKLEECLGLHISEAFRIVNEMTREKVENPLERALAEGNTVGLANHTKLIARDGNELFIDDSAAPIRNEAGDIIGAVLVFRDISERRESERELAESALALQRSNEELQQFAFAASHDLRSPLNSVNVVAQLIAKRFSDKLGQDGAEMIEFISDGVSRMGRLIEDLLALAKASQIDRDSAVSCSMHDAFEIACQNLKSEIQATGASITCAPLPVVAVRQTHLVQVLQNILSNGLKYRSALPPRIQVTAERRNSEWIIAITDNGIGIPPQYAEQVFQPFKRLHGQGYEGSGIGLSTCNKIVAGYGGRIWVESEEGQGATFYFSLPAAEMATSSAATASAHG